MVNNSVVFQDGEWSEVAYNSTVIFTGSCEGEVWSVLKPLQPDF